MEWKEIENTTVKPGDDGTDGFFQCKQEKKKKNISAGVELLLLCIVIAVAA